MKYLVDFLQSLSVLKEDDVMHLIEIRFADRIMQNRLVLFLALATFFAVCARWGGQLH